MKVRNQLKVIVTLLAAALVCLIGLTVGGGAVGYSLFQASKWVAHTDAVKVESENFNRLYTIATDAGKIAYYEESQSAQLSAKRRACFDEMENLRRITLDNPNQIDNINALNDWLTRQFAAQDDTIKTVIRDAQGRIILDNDKIKVTALATSKVSETMLKITATETDLMQTRRTEESKFQWRAMSVVAAFFFLTTFFIAVFAIAAINALWKAKAGGALLRRSVKNSTDSSIPSEQVEAFADWLEGISAMPPENNG